MGPLMPDLLIISKGNLEAISYLNSRLFKICYYFKVEEQHEPARTVLQASSAMGHQRPDTTVPALSTEPTVNVATAAALKVTVS